MKDLLKGGRVYIAGILLSIFTMFALDFADAQTNPYSPPLFNNTYAGTVNPSPSGSQAYVLRGDNVWIPYNAATGTVTSITCGAGLTCTPNPIIAAGSIILDLTATNVWVGTQTFPNNSLTLAEFPTIGANTVLSNWTSTTGNVAANTWPSCADTGGNHLNYVNGTGVTCGTSGGGGGGGITWQSTIVTGNGTTMACGNGYFTDTSGGAFTITLPASPAVNCQVSVMDLTGSWATNNLTIARNSTNIKAAAADLTGNLKNANLAMVYSGSTNGWSF